MTGKAVIITDTPDNIDYPKLRAAQQLAAELGCAIVLRNVCHECTSITTIPAPDGRLTLVTFEHEDWCPTLAKHEGRQLTSKQKRQHRRHMDGH